MATPPAHVSLPPTARVTWVRGRGGPSGGGSQKSRGLFGSATRREKERRERRRHAGRGLLWGAEPVARAGAGNWAQGPGLLAAGSGCLFTPGGGAVTRCGEGEAGKRTRKCGPELSAAGAERAGSGGLRRAWKGTG